jgi:hypothetical protein
MGEFQKSVYIINIVIKKYPEAQLKFKIKAMEVYHKLGDSKKS